MRRTPALAVLLATAVVGLSAPPSAGGAPVPTCESAHRCVVPDPRGDAFQGSAEARRLTDLRSVRWTTPRTDGGLVRARVAWPRLLDGTRESRGTRGVRPQELGITMTGADDRSWSVVVDNRGDLEAWVLREGAHDTVRVPDPDEWSVTVRRGVLVVAFSTEWVPVSRVRLDAWAETGYARDQVRRTPPLTIGAGSPQSRSNGSA